MQSVYDTISFEDSLFSRYPVTLSEEIISGVSPVLPADSLWEASTLDVNYQQHNHHNSVPAGYLYSALILSLFILFVLFSREVSGTLPGILRSIVRYRENLKIEEKLSISNQRNITVLFTVVFIPVYIVVTTGQYFEETTGTTPFLQIVYIFSIIFSYWLFKNIILAFLGWLTKNRQLFSTIGKIGYNHLIMGVFFAIPLLLTKFFIVKDDPEIFIKLLLLCALSIYLLFLIRVYQTFILHRFSQVFNILYLCTVELLPIALFINFLLSNQ